MLDILHNKGKSGQLLELLLDKPLDNDVLDFADGELKSYKSDENGLPLETIAITQLSSIYDYVIETSKFKDSKIYKKLRNVLYVGINKTGSPDNWFISKVTHIDLLDITYNNILKQLKKDYKMIRKELLECQSQKENKMIHTVSGEYLQIRSKDSKDKNGKYHPIFSNKYNNYVSSKNYAFYLKKNFLKSIL